VIEVPAKLEETPAYAGGPIDRGAPCYGEDNHYILRELLGYSDAGIDRLEGEKII
jgi:crotonobetainyl-CoA:carnitine CoA-transferase CaiB-like acyl-CoA transferase